MVPGWLGGGPGFGVGVGVKFSGVVGVSGSGVGVEADGRVVVNSAASWSGSVPLCSSNSSSAAAVVRRVDTSACRPGRMGTK